MLEQEKANYPPVSGCQASTHASIGSGVDKDATSLNPGFTELNVSHELSSNKPVPPARHVSTIERPLTGLSRNESSKPGVFGQSISFTVQTPEKPKPGPTHISSGVVSAPPTAPEDFSSFFKDSKSPTDIQSINCKTYTGSQPTVPLRTRQTSLPNDSVSNSISTERQMVKVITIPPGSSSGGSVSVSGTRSNQRHIQMHFGDTGGTCTVQTNQPTIQKHASTPNINQHYRSEFRTETSVPHSVHSSSIVLNANPHSNHLPASDRSTLASSSQFSINPFQFNKSSATSDSQSITSVSAQTSVAGVPLSTPVQASSPGISHSRPVYVEEIPHGNTDRSYQTSYMTHSSMENIPASVSGGHQFSAYQPLFDFCSNQTFVSDLNPFGLRTQTLQDQQNLNHMAHQQQQPQQQQHPVYPNQFYRPSPSSSAVYDPSFQPFSPSSSSVTAYPGMAMGAISHNAPANNFNQYSPFNPHMVTGPMSSPRNILPLLSQSLPRTNSQESEQNVLAGLHMKDFEQNSVCSDTSIHGGDVLDRTHSHNIHEDNNSEYIRSESFNLLWDYFY